MTAGGSTGGNETIQDRIAEYVFAIKKNIGRYDPSGKIRRGVRGVVLGAGLGFTALAGSCGGYFEIQNHLVQERGSYTGRVQNVSRNGVGWPKLVMVD